MEMVLIPYRRECWVGRHRDILCFETINTHILLALTGQILTVCISTNSETRRSLPKNEDSNERGLLWLFGQIMNEHV